MSGMTGILSGLPAEHLDAGAGSTRGVAMAVPSLWVAVRGNGTAAPRS